MTTTTLSTGSVLIDLTTHADNRGGVREAWRESWGAPFDVPPVKQVVHSESIPGVMRAMHAHKLQHDIWHLTAGAALAVLLDHRTGNFDRVPLHSGRTLIIPPGVSHGFWTDRGCTLTYYLTREYDGTDEYEWDALDGDFLDYRPWPFDARQDAFDGKLVRSQRDVNAKSLARFMSAWTPS